MYQIIVWKKCPIAPYIKKSHPCLRPKQCLSLNTRAAEMKQIARYFMERVSDGIKENT